MERLARLAALTLDRMAAWVSRSPMIILAVARIAVAFLAQTSLKAISSQYPDMGPSLDYVSFALLAWAILFPAALFLPTRIEMALRPVVLLIDFQLLMVIVALLRQLELPALGATFILLWAVHERLGRTIAAMIAGGVILLLLLRHHYEPWGMHAFHPDILVRIDGATVLIGCLSTLALMGAMVRRGQLQHWADRLQAVGGNLHSLPTSALLEELARIGDARKVGLIWRNLDSGEVRCFAWDSGACDTPSLPGTLVSELLNSRIADTPFLFSRQSEEVLVRNSIGTLRFRSVPELIEAQSRIFGMAYGVGFPIAAGDISGMAFIETRHGWTAGALDQLVSIQEGVESFFERFYFLSAWRERSFAEARQALSRDLHDSVLQTLAAMRMRLATIRGQIEGQKPIDLTRDMQELEDLVIREQADLRELLNESARTMHEREDLVARIRQCAVTASSQWGIDCHPLFDQDEIHISRTIAIQVEFLIREMAANAVQHAKARRLSIAISVTDGHLMIAFRDDSGRRKDEAPLTDDGKELIVQSRSLTQRLTSIGGKAYFDKLDKSSLLSIQIPITKDRSSI